MASNTDGEIKIAFLAARTLVNDVHDLGRTRRVLALSVGAPHFRAAAAVHGAVPLHSVERRVVGHCFFGVGLKVAVAAGRLNRTVDCPVSTVGARSAEGCRACQ